MSSAWSSKEKENEEKEEEGSLENMIDDFRKYLETIQTCQNCRHCFQNKMYIYRGRHPLCPACRSSTNDDYDYDNDKVHNKHNKHNNKQKIWLVTCHHDFVDHAQTHQSFKIPFVIPFEQISNDRKMRQSLEALDKSILVKRNGRIHYSSDKMSMAKYFHDQVPKNAFADQKLRPYHHIDRHIEYNVYVV